MGKPLIVHIRSTFTDTLAILKEEGKGADTAGRAGGVFHCFTESRALVRAAVIQNNAHIDSESHNGTKPLMMAGVGETPASVKLLLGEGTDSQLKNQQSLAAVQFAQRADREDSA